MSRNEEIGKEHRTKSFIEEETIRTKDGKRCGNGTQRSVSDGKGVRRSVSETIRNTK